MELTLKDFQGWKDASLRLDGFTVVVGESNRGKSALARATKAVLRNGITEANIRLGAKEARVSLDMGDAHGLVESSRARKGSAGYVVDGQEFTSLGGNIPPIMESWGFQPVEVNGTKIDPVFAGQFDSQFLLSSSPAETSAILNAFSSTERLDRGKKLLKTKVSGVDAEAKVLGAQISALEGQVADLTERASQADALRAQISTKIDAARRSSHIAAALDKLSGAVKDLAVLEVHLEAIDRVLLKGGALGRAAVELATIVRLLTIRSTTERLQGIAFQLKGIETVDPRLDAAMKSYLRLDRLIRIRQGQLQQAKDQGQLAALDKIQGPMDTVAHSYKILVRARVLLMSDPTPLKYQAAKIKDVDMQPAVHRLQVLSTLLKATEASRAAAVATAELSSIQAEQNALEAQANQAAADLAQWVQANEVITCPQCNFEFVKGEHVHEQ